MQPLTRAQCTCSKSWPKGLASAPAGRADALSCMSSCGAPVVLVAGGVAVRLVLQKGQRRLHLGPGKAPGPEAPADLQAGRMHSVCQLRWLRLNILDHQKQVERLGTPNSMCMRPDAHNGAGATPTAYSAHSRRSRERPSRRCWGLTLPAALLTRRGPYRVAQPLAHHRHSRRPAAAAASAASLLCSRKCRGAKGRCWCCGQGTHRPTVTAAPTNTSPVNS